MDTSISQLLKRLWLIQFGLICVSVGLLYGFDPIIAYSFALGAINFWLPNIYFALTIFRHSGVGEAVARLMLQNMFRGEINKFVLAATGFAVIFATVRPLNGLAVFAGFGLMIISQVLIVGRYKNL